MPGDKISDHTELTALASADEFVVVDAGASTTKRITAANLKAGVDAEGQWELVSASKYTATPANTYTLTMSDTSDMAVGMPVKYTIAAVDYFGIITALVASTSITVAGASLSGDLTALYVGRACYVAVQHYFFDGDYDPGANDLFDTLEGRAVQWMGPDAYLVLFEIKHKTDDTGANNAKINVKVGGSAVSTKDGNNGFQVSTSWSAPTTTDLVAISTANYKIEKADAIEIELTVAGSTGDPADLSIMLVFVYE